MEGKRAFIERVAALSRQPKFFTVEAVMKSACPDAEVVSIGVGAWRVTAPTECMTHLHEARDAHIPISCHIEFVTSDSL